MFLFFFLCFLLVYRKKTGSTVFTIKERQMLSLTHKRICCHKLDTNSITEAALTLEYKRPFIFSLPSFFFLSWTYLLCWGQAIGEVVVLSPHLSWCPDKLWWQPDDQLRNHPKLWQFGSHTQTLVLWKDVSLQSWCNICLICLKKECNYTTIHPIKDFLLKGRS